MFDFHQKPENIVLNILCSHVTSVIMVPSIQLKTLAVSCYDLINFVLTILPTWNSFDIGITDK